MAYFLRKEKKKKGTYLQMYKSFWDKDKKQPRTRNVKSFGYVEDLISDEIPDPIKFYSVYVKEQNENRIQALSEESRPRAFSNPVELNIGHFLLHSLIDELNVRETIDILASQMRFLIHRMTNRTFFIFTITHLVSLYAPAKDICASTRPILLCQL